MNRIALCSVIGLSVMAAGCGAPNSGSDRISATLDSAPATITAAAPATTPVLVTPKVQSAYGTVKGKLVWGGATVPERGVLVKKGDATVNNPEVCSTDTLYNRDLTINPTNKGVRFAFAYINRPKGTNPDREAEVKSKEASVIIDQKNCEFIPFATAFMTGQKLTFKSSDPVNHNVRYTALENDPFNVVLPPNATTDAPVSKAERAPTEIKCDIHAWMNGWFLVLDHPFFAVTDENGNFEIKGVPAGAQKLIVRTGKHGFISPNRARGLDVEVKGGETVDVGEIKFDPSLVR